MKGFFLTEEVASILVGNIREVLSDPRIALHQSNQEIAKDFMRQAAGEPIEINDITISEVNTPCKYYLKSNIVGFVLKRGFLMGVFIKEENET